MMLKVLHKELIDHDKVMNEYDQQIHIYLIEIKIENLHWIPMIVNEQELIPKIKISIG